MTTFYTPHENGVVEQNNHTIFEMARSMWKGKGLPSISQDEVVSTSIYLINRCPSISV
jgi:hypothetical protein